MELTLVINLKLILNKIMTLNLILTWSNSDSVYYCFAMKLDCFLQRFSSSQSSKFNVNVVFTQTSLQFKHMYFVVTTEIRITFIPVATDRSYILVNKALALKDKKCFFKALFSHIVLTIPWC